MSENGYIFFKCKCYVVLHWSFVLVLSHEAAGAELTELVESCGLTDGTGVGLESWSLAISL